VKPLRVKDEVEVVYSQQHWRLLCELRSRARQLLTALPETLLVGSVARGDVHGGSDVDIALLEPSPPSIVEERLAGKGINVVVRELVQATPLSTPRALNFNYIVFFAGSGTKPFCLRAAVARC
jgi:predicted nucleotidyltransferase